MHFLHLAIFTLLAHSSQLLEYRLPKTVLPTHYNLTIRLEPDVFVTERFKGLINITLTITNRTQKIKIHAKNLTSINLHLHGTTVYNLTNAYFISDPETEILTITSAEVLSPGQYYLHGTYDGVFSTDMLGLYKSSYKNDNVSEYLAVTQFAVTQARRVLPCFDEPEFKSTFSLSVIYPRGYQVLANTLPMTKTIAISNNLEQVLFKPSPVMSSYLLAFIVSNYTCDTYFERILYRVCSRPGTEPQRKYALEVLPKVVQALENFTGIPYTVSAMEKIDLVAIPDYIVTAMENWGLVTVEEASLLYDEYQSPISYKQKVLTVITHELAHMWFGNLVTAKWWSDAFLNEGLATLCEYYIADKIEPTWELEKQFVVEELNTALMADLNSNAVPLVWNVSTPEEIWGRFDYVSYKKGGSIVRMMAHAMTMGQFQMGIHQYLEKHKFNNTLAPDFWSSFENFTNFPYSVFETTNTWTYQRGYPVLNVNASGTSVVISQVVTNTTKWYIPVTYTAPSNGTTTFGTIWLTPQNGTATLKNMIVGKMDWIALNHHHSGYYRVIYDEKLLNRLKRVLENDTNTIEVLSKIQVLDDLFAFALINQTRYSKVLNFVEFLKNETDYFAWRSAFSGFAPLLEKLSGKVRVKLENHILSLMERLYESVPFILTHEDDHVYTLKQVMAIEWACQLGHGSCVNDSLKMFDFYKKNFRVNKNFKKNIFCTALKHSSTVEEDWKLLWSHYLRSNVANERSTLLVVLGCTSNKTVLDNYLQLAFDSDVIRRHEYLTVWGSILDSTPANVDTAADFFIGNYEKIYDFCKNEKDVTSIIASLMVRFVDEKQIDKLNSFIQNRNTTVSVKTYTTEMVNKAQTNLEVNRKVKEDLKEFFKNKKSSASFGKVSSFWLFVFTFYLCFLC